MRRVIRAAILAAFALTVVACQGAPEPEDAAATEPAESPPVEATELDVEQVSARLAAGEEITLLDVRTHEELVTDGAIEGYLHIPIDELEARLAEVPTDKPIVAY